MMRNFGKIGQSVCVILMVIVLVLQFTPYWQYDGQTASIGSYVWRPYANDALIDWLDAETGTETNVNNEIGAPILMLVLGALGLALVFVRRDLPLPSIAGVCFGAVGIFGYLSSVVLRQGNLWGLHLALCVVILVLGALGAVEGFAGNFREIRKEKENRAAAIGKAAA